MMSEDRLILALEDCVQRLSQGEAIENCLRDYPEYAQQLATLLEIGQLAQRAALPVAQVHESQARVYRRFEAALLNPRPPIRPFRRFFSLIAAVLLTLILLLAGTTYASQSSLPGDALYSVKRAGETVQLIFSGNNRDLVESFNQRRIDETQELLALGRSADVGFTGLISEISDSHIVVAGLRLERNAETQINVVLEIGQRVRVDATVVSDGNVILRVIQPLQPDNVAPHQEAFTPTVTTSSTERASSATPRPQPTDEPNVQREAVTATPTLVRPTATILSPTMTVSPSPSPSATSTIAPPTATATSVPCTVVVPSDWERYRVQAGDSLFALAVERGITLDELLRVNCIADPNLISVGQVIYLPAQSSPDPTRTEETRPTDSPVRDTDTNARSNTDVRPTNTEAPARDRNR